MLNNPPYGYLPKLAELICARWPDENSISILTNEMAFRILQDGYTVNRDSCNRALVTVLTRLGRTRDSSAFGSIKRPFGAETWNGRDGAPGTIQVEVTIEIEEEIPGDEAGWRVHEDHYTWHSKSTNKTFRRLVADVDEMFYSYSVHGLNLSQVQMMQDFGLSMWEWNTLKARLFLQKQSNVFSPHTVALTPAKELEAMMEAKMARRYERQGPLIERAHRNAAVKQLNKVLAEKEGRDTRLQQLVSELADLLPAVKYRYVARAPRATNGPEHLVFTLADPHVGAQVKKLLNAPRYNREVLYQYADQLIERINARGAANVYLAGLGDYAESFTGLSHINSWLQMDNEVVRAGAVRACVEFFAYLVEGINNLKEIWGVSGNHDRTSSDKKEDSRGEAADIIFMFLEERYAKVGIVIHYRYDLLVREVDGICYILGHSHLNMLANEKKAIETIGRHRIPGLYCVLLSAHLHTRIVKLDSDDCRWVFAPSFFTGNNYSSDGGWSTLAGFLTIENAGGSSGFPRIIDEPLAIGRFTPARLAA